MAFDSDSAASASELERLISDLSVSGELVFVFGVGWHTTHLTGTTEPVFRGPQERRWWHVEEGTDETKGLCRVWAGELRGVCLFERDEPAGELE